MLNAEAQPPHVEIGHPVNGLGGERRAVVGADRERESILAKRPLKVGFAETVWVEDVPRHASR